MSSDGTANLVFIRVTLLGHAKSGKSSLVNNMVNNAFSQSYQKTTEAALYYTTVRIQGGSSEENNNHNTLVEIEDTFASSDIGTVALPETFKKDRTISDFYDLYWPFTKEGKTKELEALRKGEKSGTDGSIEKDKFGVARSLAKPLSTMMPPIDGIYRPLTTNRMAFLIVFDSNDEDSYIEAIRLYEQLLEYHEKKKDAMKPLLFLAANKIDLDPNSEQHRRILASAQAYADFQRVPFFHVSALQFQGVKRLFRNIVQMVRARRALWMQASADSKHEDTKEENPCSLQ